MIDYLNIAYLDQQLENDLVGKKYEEHTMKALNHIKELYFPVYRITKAVDLLTSGYITEQEFHKEYNVFRSLTGCVCKDD